MSTTTTLTRPAAHHSPTAPPPGARTAVRIGLAVPLVAVLLFVALAWPALRTAPRELPLGVVGPPPAVEQVTGALERERPGALDVRTYADVDALERGIRERAVYGGLVLDPAAPQLLTASAASPAAAQVLVQVSDGIGAALSQQAGRPVAVQVRDVVPTPAEDPRAAGVAAMGLPLTIAAIAPAASLVLLLRRRTGPQLLGLAVAVAVASLAVAGVLDLWFGTTGGHLLEASTALAVGLSATGLLVLGLGRLLGRVGLALGAALALLLGNPLSAAASAPELLPSGWGALGQLLPQGATVSLLRSLVWFDGAAAGGPVLVLLGWIAVGAALVAVAALRDRGQAGVRSNGEE